MPKLSIVTAQYRDTPREIPGFERLGYVSHWTLGSNERGRPWLSSPVPLKRDSRYAIVNPYFERRLAEQSRIGPLMLEIEVAGGGRTNPHLRPEEPEHARDALRYVGSVRQAVANHTDSPIVAEFTNAIPRGFADRINLQWLVDRQSVEVLDWTAWFKMRAPESHTFAAYGKPGPRHFWRGAVRLERAKAIAKAHPSGRRPINVVISHIDDGRRHSTPREVAMQARFWWKRLGGGDRLIYWAAGEPGKTFDEGLAPWLDAVRSEVK